MTQAKSHSKQTKKKNPVSVEYKQHIADTVPVYKELFTEVYFQREFCDEEPLKPRHIENSTNREFELVMNKGMEDFKSTFL